ncbi:hypothetical protein Taro_013074, partial [Colocasia esculenta]|nr:hypothetical protein [Colocasia esculenta]
MRATLFAPYVDIPPMKCFGISLLEEIVAHHEVGNVFNIGNKSLSFTVEDVALILGMPCTGFPVHHYGSSIEESKLHKRFGKDTAFTRQVIHGYLIDLVGSDEKEDIEDIARLWILLLLSTFLSPWSVYICSPQKIEYLDNIERIRSYAWAVAFHELILHNIEEASKMVKMNAKRGRHDEKPRKNQFTFGCSYALCVWLLEHIHAIPPISCLIFPRLFRWDASLKKKGKMIVDHLQVTSTPALSINAEMAALVDALKATKESRKVENEDFRQKLESIMTQVEGFAKSVISLRQEKEKPADMQVIFVEDRRDFDGCELLVEEDRQLITKFLSMEINYESIFVNKWNGEVTRYNIHELLFGKNVGDDMIDCAVQLLEESCSLSDYKKWEYLPTLIVSSIHTGKHASISQKGQRLFESFPAATDLEHLGKLDLLFFVLHTTNHWHLLVVDLKNRCFISYNSIKGNKSYDAAVRI